MLPKIDCKATLLRLLKTSLVSRAPIDLKKALATYIFTGFILYKIIIIKGQISSYIGGRERSDNKFSC